MKSKVIQAIRQTGFAIISFLFFSFSELESKKQFTQATHVTQRSLRSKTQIPSVIACKAVRQGSTMLIIEKFRVGRTWWYKKIGRHLQRSNLQTEGSNSCSCSHSSNERGLQFIVIVACGLSIDVVHSRRGLVRALGCGSGSALNTLLSVPKPWHKYPTLIAHVCQRS